MKQITILLVILGFIVQSLFAQTGISVSPPRVYFEAEQGKAKSEKILVTNVSQTHTMDLSISFEDWEYDAHGHNVLAPPNTLATSCVSWIKFDQPTLFSLKTGESKELELILTVPTDADTKVPVHTVVMYVSQLNPADGLDEKGASIKVSVRSGIKIFHRFPSPRNRDLEIENFEFNKEQQKLTLQFKNLANVWVDGTVYVDLLNTLTGKKYKLEPLVFYSLPGNLRIIDFNLPTDLPKGKYAATVLVDKGEKSSLDAAELIFTYE